MMSKYIQELLFASLLLSAPICSRDVIQETFTQIYDKAVWGRNHEGRGFSGGGSLAEHTREYRAFLQSFIEENQIRSVVDVGCGDWEFSQLMNWDNVDYIGVDVVESVINRNILRFSKPNIHFVHSNALNFDLPEADLMICKDVLQHLPIEAILEVIQQLPKFKYCLITNDFQGNGLNQQIKAGECRPLDLTRPPFNVRGTKVFTFKADGMKQVLLIQR